MNPRLQQPCPVCGAGRGQRCRALNQKAYARPRSTVHRERPRGTQTESMAAVHKKMVAAKPEEFGGGRDDFGDQTHGISRYAAGCRCSECRQARAAYEAERRMKLRGTLPPDDPRHGTTNAYVNYGCRCDPCAQAERDYVHNLRERTRLAVSRVGAK